MNRLSIVRIALSLMIVSLAGGCKSSKATDRAESTSTEPVAIAVRATETAEPFPPDPKPGPADAELDFRKHKVKKGDTFYGIAKQYGVSPRDVMNANPGIEPTQLGIGQEVIVPFAKK